jgi:Increased loss of mitochondrial DNA protein 1
VVHLATLYSEIWTLLAGLRFCFFFAIAIFIYQGRAGAEGMRNGIAQHYALGYDGTQEMKQGLAQLKSRVVFTFVFEETMFWLWVCCPTFCPMFHYLFPFIIYFCCCCLQKGVA